MRNSKRSGFVNKSHRGAYLCVRKVVVGLEGGVQGGDEVEQRLARDRVAERDAFVAGVAAVAEERRHVAEGLRGRERLQVGRRLLGGDEALVELLIVAGHLAAVAFDASKDRGVARLDRQSVVDGLEAR